ncbi:unnamed protein product [Prunus brigantina]
MHSSAKDFYTIVVIVISSLNMLNRIWDASFVGKRSFNFTGVASCFCMSDFFEEVEGFVLGFWTEHHLRKMMSLRRSSKQLAVFGNSTILDHSPYPTGAKDHDYKTWDTCSK